MNRLKARSIWEIEVTSSSSRNWKKIIKLREFMMKRIKVIIRAK